MSTSCQIVCARCGAHHDTFDAAVRCCQTPEERP